MIAGEPDREGAQIDLIGGRTSYGFHQRYIYHRGEYGASTTGKPTIKSYTCNGSPRNN
jgi:hypothetical protein